MNKEGPNPSGLCMCGCGGKTKIAKGTRTRYGHVKGQPVSFLPGHHMKGENSRIIMAGYPAIYAPQHPRGNHNGYVHEHVLIAEKALGKFLPLKAVVHHHTPEQLVVCQDIAYHNLVHRRKRAYEACGHANWRMCRFCRRYDDVLNLKTPKSDVYHSKCLNNYLHSKRQED